MARARLFLDSNVNGAPGAIRTRGLWLRRPTLYPTELRAHYPDNVQHIYICGSGVFPLKPLGRRIIRLSNTAGLLADPSIGAPGRSRTCGLRIRSPTLYPAELRARVRLKTVETVQCDRLKNKKWGERRGLNPRPSGPQPDALPAELRPPYFINEEGIL